MLIFRCASVEHLIRIRYLIEFSFLCVSTHPLVVTVDSVFRKLPVVSDRTVDGEDEDASTSKRPGGLNRYGGGPYRNGSQSAEDKYDNTV